MSKDDKKLHLIPGFIRHDFLRKLIALIFAILVWQRVYSEIAVDYTLFDIPVNISLPAQLERTDDQPLKVNLTVKASRRIINNPTLKADIKIDVKLTEDDIKGNPLTISHKINPKDISMPTGITLLQISPENINISVDRKISKTVPVEVTISGYLLDIYTYKQTSIIPRTVVITGPKSIIEQMKVVKTEPIILKPENVEDFETEVNLDSEKNVAVNRKAVTVQIEIYKKFDVREFNDIPIKTFGAPATPGQAVLKPAKAFIIVDGAKKSVEIMQDKELHPFVDVTGLKVPGKYSLPVQCWVDDKDVKIKEIKPKQIDVELKEP